MDIPLLLAMSELNAYKHECSSYLNIHTIIYDSPSNQRLGLGLTIQFPVSVKYINRDNANNLINATITGIYIKGNMKV